MQQWHCGACIVNEKYMLRSLSCEDCCHLALCQHLCRVTVKNITATSNRFNDVVGDRRVYHRSRWLYSLYNNAIVKLASLLKKYMLRSTFLCCILHDGTHVFGCVLGSFSGCLVRSGTDTWIMFMSHGFFTCWGDYFQYLQHDYAICVVSRPKHSRDVKSR